jgi:DNA-binding HxlR family transcriptional regulator
MPSYGQYCPVASAAEVLGDRWTLLILREMVGGSTRFNELERCLPRISRSLLSQRLRQLTRAGIVETVPLTSGRGNEYHLSPAGKELEPIILAMAGWAARWILDEPREEDVDPLFLMWWMHNRVNLDRLPSGRTVMRFDIVGGARREVFWMLLSREGVSLCQSDPGFDVDVQVTADKVALQRVFGGWTDLADVSGDLITADGRPALARQWSSWFAWAPYRDDVRSRQPRTTSAT